MAAEQAIEEAIRHVRELFDSGAPVFTRQGIRGLAEQLEKIRATGQPATVTVPSIDGRMVSLGVVGTPVSPEAFLDPEVLLPVTGVMCDAMPQWYSDEHARGPLPPPKPDGDEKRVVRLAPFIHYSAIGHLLKKSRQESPEGVYLPLSVYHRWVNTETGEPLSHYRVSAEAPYEQLLEGFRRERARWEGSGACNQLRQTLASAGVQQVDKIIGFACSTMYRYGQFSYICAMQHALLLSLRDFFTPSATNAQAPRCIVQDPSYQAADREILEGEGMSIVDDPWGFLEVDETSVVFSCGPDVPVQDIVANIARPAVMIWDDRFGASYKPFEEQLQEEITWQVTPGCRYGAYRSLLTWAADLLRADPISPRSEKMIRDHYTRFDFPKFPEDAAYGFADGVAIYVRRREGENADE